MYTAQVIIFNTVTANGMHCAIPTYIRIHFEVSITFVAIWLVDAARLSGDSYWLPSDYNMAPYRIAIMNDDIGKFEYNSMQQRTKRQTS